MAVAKPDISQEKPPKTGASSSTTAASTTARGGIAGSLRRVLGGFSFARKNPKAGCESSSAVVLDREENLPPTQSENDIERFVERMIAQGRYAFLLRPQIAPNLPAALLRRALKALEENMALVPDGDVTLQWRDPIRSDQWPADDEEDDDYQEPSKQVVRVRRYFLDRYPVTNRQYYEFVAAGGYEQMSLWDEEIWPAILEFVDRTGHPGPRFWKNGIFEPGTENHPVVGISWYEAVAYARWVGKRLPTDAEWVRAASWPVTLSDGTRVQRNYPWGDAMDYNKANVWGTGHGNTIPVDELAAGVSVGGVYQLIGNTWEWLQGEFPGPGFPFADVTPAIPMKSIRGGAFDTYFDSQACCHFQSGEVPLARAHNIGFRCALSASDVVLAITRQDRASAEPTDTAEQD